MVRIPTGHSKRELQKLSPRHIQILERLVRANKPKDIARDMGICTQTISNLRNITVGLEMLRKMNMQRYRVAITTETVGEKSSTVLPDFISPENAAIQATLYTIAPIMRIHMTPACIKSIGLPLHVRG